MTTDKHPHIATPIHSLVKCVLLGAVILAAGAAIGASVMFIYLSQTADRPGREPEIVAERMLRQLSGELDLTPEQRNELDPILRRHHRELRAIRASVRPHIVSQLEQLDSDLANVLTDEQLDRWQDKVSRLEDYFPTYRGPGRRMGPGRRQEHSPGPHGPREPLGPGYRRQMPIDPNAEQPHYNQSPQQ